MNIFLVTNYYVTDTDFGCIVRYQEIKLFINNTETYSQEIAIILYRTNNISQFFWFSVCYKNKRKSWLKNLIIATEIDIKTKNKENKVYKPVVFTALLYVYWVLHYISHIHKSTECFLQGLPLLNLDMYSKTKILNAVLFAKLELLEPFW